MVTLSKPLSAGQAHRYHADEFRSTRENYYSSGDRIVGQWHGRLAATWGLEGDVRDEQFARLAEGHHPLTDDILVRHQTARESTNARGASVMTMEHRAGWDATFSAPKSVSLTALVGGDARVREAHRDSVTVALNELERYTQGRLGGNQPAEWTGQWVAATFEHDSARPVDGYAAPQVHTHAVIFNLTQTDDCRVRPLQPRELYRTQAYATAVYRSELAARLTALGYEVERGKNGQPEIAGYTPEYLEASSPRRQQILDHLARTEQHGAAAAQIAAHQTRDAKGDLSREEVQERHQAIADAFGRQPARVVEAARSHEPEHVREPGHTTAGAAVTFAIDRQIEREAVVDERDLLREALQRSMGERTLPDLKADVEQRIEVGDILVLAPRQGTPDRTFTTPDMQEIERDTIARMHAGQHAHEPLVRHETADEVVRESTHLNDRQRDAVREILSNRDTVMALDGVAGAGKTTALAAVREAVERDGYAVRGLAPTSRAAHQLEEAGIPAHTLQWQLAQRAEPSHQPTFYVVDESSLASARQVNAFLHRVQAHDRVLLVGDARQHQAVEAGRPYEQLREAGIATARLDTIVRQQDPALKEVVERLSRGEIRDAAAHLERQGRVHEFPEREARFRMIAKEYAKEPERTLIVSPDNASRRALNEAVHRTLQGTGRVETREHPVRVLVPHQDMTGADRQWAARYQPEDVVRYSKGSQVLGLAPGEYARVERTNEKENTVTVCRDNGDRVTYDPRRLQGVTLYREEARAMANGDRVQMTAPDRDRHVANRELGTIERIDASGQMQVRLDSGRPVTFAPQERMHLDYGYAVTSHSSQGQTADRVLVHVDTTQSRELVNQRFAYVAVSRSRFDAHIYTDDRTRLPDTLSREVSHRSAIELTPTLETPQTLDRSTSQARQPDISIERGR